MKRENLFLIVIAVCLAVSAVFSVLSYDMLRSGKHLTAVHPQLILSADCPWAAMPPGIKEYISLNATNITKLNKEDMLQLSVWYKEQAAKYKEPITLLNNADYPQNKKESKDGN